MKLDRITLENFRQYYGRQRLTFSKNPQRNVTVIHGINGAGKSSLFLGLNWCLYGSQSPNTGELISKEAISQAQAGDSIRTSVELAFDHDGERYLVSRRLMSVKQDNGAVQGTDESEDGFTVMRTRRDGSAIRVDNPVGVINSILPSNASTYFLFDAEKIDNFSRPEASSQVRHAIYNVLKLEILTRGRKHLEDVAAEYRRELRLISKGELRDLVEREEKARAEKDRVVDRKGEVESEIESARRKIIEIEQRLRDMQSASVLQQRRDRIEQELKQRQSELDGLILQVKALATSSYVIAAQPIAERALAVLEEKRKRGEIPSNIRQQFVQDLLDELQCICGRPVEQGSVEYQRLLNLMSSKISDAVESQVSETGGYLRSSAERAKALRQSVDDAMLRRTQLVDIVKAHEAELDDINRELKDSPQEEISSLENQRDKFRADIEDYRLEQVTADMRIEELNKQIAELEAGIEKAKKDENKQRALTRKVALAQRGADAIDEVYQSFADEMRRRIEEKTKEVFKLLIWKDSHFSNIQLGPDYNLEVIDRYNSPARPELSAGERQVLSLSFITAMSRVSEEEAPLVMDTPFGRLSSHHRNSITEQLPKLADQLVLFVTDEELHGQARKNLERYIGAEYRLNFDRRTSCTHIDEEKA
jgi:DNA sulfur modification protein DndD